MSAKSSDIEKTTQRVMDVNQQIESLARQFLNSLFASHELINDHVRLLTSILDSMNDGLVVVDSENKLMLTNRAAVRLAGIDPEADWQSQLEENYKFFDGKTGLPIKFGEGIVAAALKDRKPREAEVFVRGHRLPNEEAWFRLSSAPIIRQDGHLQGAVTVFQDISEAKAALNKAKELYNGAPCGYHSLSADGVFAEINNTEIGWLGAKREELVMKAKFPDYLTKTTRPIFDKHFTTLSSTGSLNNVELELVGTKGETRNVLWSSIAINDSSGKLFATRCTLFDITERSQLQEELDVLTALIAHDIKNHLVATAGVMEFMVDDRTSTISAEARPVIDGLRLSNQDQLQALNNLINLRTAGAYAQAEDANVSSLLDEAAGLVAEVARLRNVSISIRPQENLPLIWAPRTALRHVLCNLLHNAIKFSKPAQSVQVTAYLEDGGVTIVVSDSGPGITKTDVQNLFRVRTKRKPSGFSTGLGLYLCHQIIQAAGGKLTCESEPGKGTRFLLHLDKMPKPNHNNSS